jgi:ketosteroid isomerase-like protein
MRRHLLFISVCLFATAAPALLSETSADEQTLWSLERAYWRYVENNDLAAYSDLFHKDFLGWPAISSVPLRKDHITDWITFNTRNGGTFKTWEFKPAAIQVIGNVAFVCYWITFNWLDVETSGPPRTLRITHAWLRSGKDWRIIGGMSTPEVENPSK